MIKRALDKVLNKLGYYRAEMPTGPAVSEKEALELFRTYGANETFMRLLRDWCASDIRLYFQATNEKERDIIRGAYRRAHHIITLIQKTNEPGKPGKRN